MVPLGPADVPKSRSFRTIGGIASPPLFKAWDRQISQNHRGPHASPDGLSAIACQVSRTQRNLVEGIRPSFSISRSQSAPAFRPGRSRFSCCPGYLLYPCDK